MAEYLRSGFGARQIGNTYNVVSNGLEQMMTLLILVVGAYNELRHYFGGVPRETILFSGAIYDNPLMANPHTTIDQIVQCCKMAEIPSAIEALPQGYQTEIGERGVGLSGGQKQRMAIACALIKQPKILVFDEATSSLDSNTAEQCELHTISFLHFEIVVDSPTLAVLRRHYQPA